MTSITWAGPRCVQEAAAIFGSQNRTQGRCGVLMSPLSHNVTPDPARLTLTSGHGACVARGNF